MIMAYEKDDPEYGKTTHPLKRSQTIKHKGWSLIMCLLVLALVMASGTALPTQTRTFTGPLMAINGFEGYVVVNEVMIYVHSLPDPTIVESLTEGQWVSVEVSEQGGQLWATELAIGKESSTTSAQDSN